MLLDRSPGGFACCNRLPAFFGKREVSMRNMARLLAFAVAIGLILTTAPVQAAEPQANGGCRTRTGGGWQIAVCSADDGVFMYPDFWVDIRPPYTGTCEIRSYIYFGDQPSPGRLPESFSCSTNHGVASPLSSGATHPFSTFTTTFVF